VQSPHLLKMQEFSESVPRRTKRLFCFRKKDFSNICIARTESGFNEGSSPKFEIVNDVTNRKGNDFSSETTARAAKNRRWELSATLSVVWWLKWKKAAGICPAASSEMSWD